jgi:hypothetical protein
VQVYNRHVTQLRAGHTHFGPGSKETNEKLRAATIEPLSGAVSKELTTNKSSNELSTTSSNYLSTESTNDHYAKNINKLYTLTSHGDGCCLQFINSTLNSETNDSSHG